MFVRFRVCALAWACAAGAGLGCSHFVETRAISSFTEALDTEDLEALRETTSDDFGQKALRSTEALEDLKILRLPTGKTSVVKVEDTSDSLKKVKVQAGKSKKQLLYKLVKNESTGDWVVDDVYVQQKRKGVTTSRWATVQMDLLLTVREFVDAWQGGSRNDVLAVSGPELSQVLGELPPSYLARLTARVAGDGEKSRRKPEAHLDRDMAVVTLPRSTGRLVLTCRMQDGKWKVGDVALQSKDEEEHVPSVLMTATAMNAAILFLDAYAAEDKQTLSRVTTPKFYARSLEPSDLSRLALPRSDAMNSQFELDLQPTRAEFVLTTTQDIVKVSMERITDEAGTKKLTTFKVDEATLFEADGSQEKRLSAVFTSHATAEIFAEALRERDLPVLQKISSLDFNRRVWDRLDAAGLRTFPLMNMEQGMPRVVQTKFQGARTDITVDQGGRKIVYVLKGRGGEMLVDDVIAESKERPDSMKATFELLVPVHGYTMGIRASDVGRLQRSSSDDFNRLVWNQVRSIPAPAFVVPSHLDAGVTRVELGDEAAVVHVGSPRSGARVSLVEERDAWVVDDVLLIAGELDEQRSELKAALRTEVARQSSGEPAATRRASRFAPKPRTAAGTAPFPADDNASAVDTSQPLPDELGEMPLY